MDHGEWTNEKGMLRVSAVREGGVGPFHVRGGPEAGVHRMALDHWIMDASATNC